MKVPSVLDAVTLDGQVFQARGAATENARSPIVVRHEDGVTRADVDEDRSLFLLSTSAHNVARSTGSAEPYLASEASELRRVADVDTTKAAIFFDVCPCHTIFVSYDGDRQGYF